MKIPSNAPAPPHQQCDSTNFKPSDHSGRYALKCVRKRDVVEKNVQDALVSELSILKEALKG